MKYKKTVIQRVLKRGNTDEIVEIMRFYDLTVSELQKHKTEAVKFTNHMQNYVLTYRNCA